MSKPKETKKTVEKKNPLLEEEEETAEEASEETSEEEVETEESEDSEAESETEEEEEKESPKPKETKKTVGKDSKPAPAKVDAAKELLSDIQLTKKNLEAEEQVKFMVPLAQGEKKGSVHDVFVNGYHYPVRKGVMVTIPMSIATMLAEHYEIEFNAGADFLIDNDPAKQNALT